MEDKEVSYINIRLSTKLKQSFADMCQEREISISDAVRDLVANSVRNYSRKNVKGMEKD